MFRLLAILALILTTAESLPAQTYTGTGSGNFSNIQNWNSGVGPIPFSSPTTDLRFNNRGTGTPSFTNDFNLQVRLLTVANQSTGTLTLNNTLNGTYAFNGLGTGIENVGNGGATTFSGATFHLQSVSDLTGPGAGNITLSGGIHGVAGLNIATTQGNTGTGIIGLNAANTFTGGVTLNSGTIELTNQNALGVFQNQFGTLTVNGGNVRGTIGFVNPVLLVGTVSYNGSTSTNFNGPIGGNGGINFRPSGTSGNMVLTAENTYKGATLIAGRDFAATNVDGGGVFRITGAAGSAALSSSYTVRDGAIFEINNNNGYSLSTTRLNATAPISINSGFLQLIGNAGFTQQTYGTTSVSGQATILANTNGLTPSNTLLTISNLVRSPGGFVVFTGGSLGTGVITPGTGTIAQIVVNNINGGAPVAALVGGGGADGTPTVSILPWAFADASNTGTNYSAGSTFATVGPNGVRGLNTASEYNTGNNVNTAGVNDNIRINAAPTALSANRTVNSVFFSTTGLTLAGSPNTLTITSGALASTVAASTISAPVNFNAEANVFVGGGGLGTTNQITLSGGFTATNLTKSGHGVLNITTVNPTLSGTLTINGGFVTVDSITRLGAISGIVFNAPTFSNRATLSTTNAGTETLGVPITVNGGYAAIRPATATSVLNLDSNISGPGGVFYESGNSVGVISVRGTNSYTGGTRFGVGITDFDSDARLGDPSGVVVMNTATVRLSGNWVSSRNIHIEGSGVTLNTNGFNATLSGTLTGNATLAKNGAGTLTLTGANNGYNNTLSINSGTLDIVGNLDAAAISFSGANITIANAPGSRALRNLQAGGGTIALGNNNLIVGESSGALPVTISGNGGLVKVGTGTLNLAGATGNTYLGGTQIYGGILTIQTNAALGSAASNLIIGGGTLNANGNIATARNFILTGSSLPISSGAAVVTIPNGITNASGNLSWTAGGITGTGGLNVTGSGGGILQLQGLINSFTGDLQIGSAGVVQISADSNLGNASNRVRFNGGTLSVTAGSFVLPRTLIATAANTGSAPTFTIASGNTPILTGSILGNVALFKTGAGGLILNGENPYYYGTFTVGDGISATGNLNLSGSGSLPRATITTGVGANTTINIINLPRELGGLNTTSGSTVDIGVSGNLTAGYANASMSLAGTLSGAGFATFTKIGTGTLDVINANPGFTGIVRINGSGAVTLTAAAGSFTGATGLTIGGILTPAGIGPSLTIGSATTNVDRLPDTITVNSNSSTFVFTSNTTTTNSEVYGGLNGSGQTFVTLSQGGTLSGGTTGLTRQDRGTFNFRAAANTLGSGAASTTIANIIFANSATLTGQLIGGGGVPGGTVKNVSILPYASGGSATGASFVTYGTNGIYALATTDEFLAVPDSASFNAAPADNNVRSSPLAAATISLAADKTVNSLIVAGGGGANTVRIDGAFRLTLESGAILSTVSQVYAVGSNTFTGIPMGLQTNELRTGAGNTRELVAHINNGDLNIGAAITNSGGLTKSGASILYLTNSANTFTGGVTVNNGILNVDNLASVNAVSNTLTLSGGVFRYRGANANFSQSVILGGTGTGTINVTSGSSLTIQSVIGLTGNGNLAKDGTGTLAISGAKTFTGATIIRGGALVIDNPGSLGSHPTLYFGDSTGTSGGGVLRITSSMTFSKNVTMSEGTTAAGFGFDVTAGNSVALSGTITSNSAQTRGLYKVGSGELVLSANNNYFGATQVFGGTLRIGGANGAVISSQGTGGYFNQATYYIAPGAAIILDNHSANNNNRIGDVWDTPFGTGNAANGLFHMHGGEFTIRSHSSGTSERINQFNQFTGTITLDNSSGGQVTLISGRVNRVSSISMALIRGNNLGAAPGPGTANWFAVDLGSGSTQTGGAGGAAGTPFVNIVPGYIGANTVTGTGSELMTYDSAVGFRMLTPAEYQSTIPTTNFETSRAPIIAVAAATTLTTDPNSGFITAVKMGTGSVLAGNAHVVLTQSTILATGSASIDIPAVGAVSNAGYAVHVSNAGDTLTVNAVLTGNSLTKYGQGRMQLNQPLVGGSLTVGQGTVAFGPNGRVSPLGGQLQVLEGAVLDLTQSGALVDSIITPNIVGITNLNQAQDGTISLGSKSLTLFGTSATQFTGVITGTDAVGAGVTKSYNSTGTFTLTQPQTYTSPTTVFAGTLNLAGAATLQSGVVNIRGGTLQFTNSDDSGVNTGYVANRLPDTSTLNLAGTLTVTANANAVQDITLPNTNLAGSGVLNATAGAGAPTTITFTQLNRAANRGTYSQNASSAGLPLSPAGNTRVFASLIDGAAPTSALIGGGGANGSLTVSIVPWAINTSGNTSFLTYGANGFRPLDTTVEYSAGGTMVVGNTNNNDNVRQTTVVSFAAAGTVEINSLINTGQPLSGSDFANTLIVRSGAIAFTGGGFINPGTNGTLALQTGAGNTRELVVFNSAAAQIAATIGTTGGLTKYGSGALTLSGVNTFSGGLAIHGGTVNFSELANLGETGQNIAMGGDSPTLNSIRGLVYTGNTTITLTNPIVLNSIGGFSSSATTGTHIVTLAGNITGDGTFHVTTTGAAVGVVELDGNNTYTGGTVFFTSTGAFSIISIMGDQSLGNGAGIEINASAATPIMLRGDWTTSKILRMASTSTNYPINTNGFNATLNGPMVSNGIAKVGSGTLTFTYPNAGLTLGIAINGGDVVLAGNGALAGGTQTLGFGTKLILDNSGTYFPDRIGDGTNITNNNGDFRLLGNSGTAVEEVIGNLTLGLASTVSLVPDLSAGPTEPVVLRVNGTFTRSNNSGILFRGDNLGTTIPGTPGVTNMMLTFPLSSGAALTGGSGAAGSTAVSIIAGAFGDTSSTGQGSQMVTYDFNNGVRLLNSSEFVTNPFNHNGRFISDNVRVDSSTLTTANASTVNSLWLSDGTSDGTGTLTLASGTLLATGTGNFVSNVLATPSNFALSICVADGGDLTFNAAPAPVSGAGLIKRGAGTLTLNALATFSGTVTLASGTVVVGHANALGAAANTVRVVESVTLQSTVGAIPYPISLSGDLTFSGTSDLTLNGALTLESANRTINVAGGRTLTVSGLIGTNAAGIGLNKYGPGMLIIPTNNTNYGTAASNFYYLASTNVNGGTLRATNATGSATGSTQVFVNSSGTLDGTGTIIPAQTLQNRNYVIVNNGGTIRPGIGAAGRLTIGSTATPGVTTAMVNLNAGSIFGFNYLGTPVGGALENSGGSSIVVTGHNNLLVNGQLNIDAGMNTAITGNIANFNVLQIYSFEIATATSAFPVSILDQARFDTTNFAGFSGQFGFNVSTVGGSVFLNFVPVPEPSLLLLAGLGVLAIRRRK